MFNRVKPNNINTQPPKRGPKKYMMQNGDTQQIFFKIEEYLSKICNKNNLCKNM